MHTARMPIATILIQKATDAGCPDEVGLLPRCCHQHSSLAELGEHLSADYDDLGPASVARELGRADTAAEWMGLVEGRLDVVELVTRAQLEMIAGRRPDIARLDPEVHRGHA